MTLYGECPQDKPKCEKENCKYYDDWSGNCSISGGWVDRSNYCKDGDFYNPYPN